MMEPVKRSMSHPPGMGREMTSRCHLYAPFFNLEIDMNHPWLLREIGYEEPRKRTTA
jgi:hypothetical protein